MLCVLKMEPLAAAKQITYLNVLPSNHTTYGRRLLNARARAVMLIKPYLPSDVI
jgi:hypothetical protein